MKKTALLLALCSVLSVMPVRAENAGEYTYVSYKDTSVRKPQPDRNYGDWNQVVCGGDERAYYSFDISKSESDDAKVLEVPNPKLGFW